jgi:hypothetical protein
MRHLENSHHRSVRSLLTVREWWWNRDRRRHIAQIVAAVRLDEEYVIDALARQLEEIRNLPEVAR